jgi:hypothetical protein
MASALGAAAAGASPRDRTKEIPMATTVLDPHAQLRALYQSLLTDHARFDEFKRMLALYDVPADKPEEPTEAAALREQLNDRIREWLGGDFDGMDAQQTRLWKAILVENRINVALSPWKESNFW